MNLDKPKCNAQALRKKKIKYYIILPILLLMAIRGVGQEHCSEIVSEESTEEVWDWRLQSSFDNVLVKRKGNEEPYVLYPLYNPFFDQFSNVNTNHLQPNSNTPTPDFEPNEGWELVYKNFGRFDGSGDEISIEDPTFVLYNKHRSILRVFIYARTYFQANTAKIKLSFFHDTSDNSVMNGALTNGQPVEKALDSFDKSITMEAMNHYSTDGNYWLFADFPIAYDPCACSNKVIFQITPELIYEIENARTEPLYEQQEISQFYAPGSVWTPNLPNNSSPGRRNPTYNNLLGVFNLLETPVIEHTYSYSAGASNYGRDKLYIRTENYKLKDDNIKYVINPASGLELVDIKAALFFDTKIPPSKGSVAITHSYLDNIKSEYKNEESDTVVTRTPYLPLGCLSEFVAEFKDSINTRLDINHFRYDTIVAGTTIKFLVRLRPKDNPNASDVFLTTSYEVERKMVSSLGTPVTPLLNYSQTIKDLTLTSDKIIEVWENATIGDNIVTNGHTLTVIAGSSIEIEDGVELDPNIELIQQNILSCSNDGFVPQQTFLEIKSFCNDENKYKPSFPETKKREVNNVDLTQIEIATAPNPFLTNVKISFRLPQEEEITLEVYNILGQKIETIIQKQLRPTGFYSEYLDGSHLTSGIYFVTLSTNDDSKTVKIVKQ
jgi:hypothetical protein